MERMEVAEVAPKGAIFDQDGLLFDTEVIFEQSWIKAGKELGLPIDLELTHRLSGCGKKELAAIIAETFPASDSEAVVDLAHSLAAEAQLAMTPVMKSGVREILSFCKIRGIRTAIASSSMRHLVDHNLAATGLAEFFDAVVTGRDVANGKPAPDIFLLAAERIGVPPSDCVVFEDSFTGIRAAHAAGCRPVLIPDRRAPTPEILEICETFPVLNDAITLLGGMKRECHEQSMQEAMGEVLKAREAEKEECRAGRGASPSRSKADPRLDISDKVGIGLGKGSERTARQEYKLA